ncbi:S-layer homology domain-containing protein, partial [Synergistaceae bacterium OttesenSCG-928-D05]|nr:S-layer homology domain-containing protein [Synergistaceae bacterium OttesenSCG-928-D05]
MKKRLAIFLVFLIALFAAPAFAANPFMDVPAGHWAYDAVAQLAARGIVSGYPDGAYKGAQPATRYELASVVARAMTRIDMEKASRQDVEIMKRLMLEFKDELDALGVKVDQLDKRVAKLEDGVGGWKIRGIFRFDAKFADSEIYDTYQYNSSGLKNEFSKEQFRLYLTKTIDENTYFYAQYRTGGDSAGGSGLGDQEHHRWSHLYVDTKLPWDLSLRVGRFAVDFEDDYGLYIDNDALFGDFRTDGFQLRKTWNNFTGTALIGRNDATDSIAGDGTHMTYALDFHWTPNEKLFAGATGYWMIEDSATGGGDWDANTYAIYAGFNFTPAIQLKGIYYFQNLGADTALIDWDPARTEAPDDSPSAWKV